MRPSYPLLLIICIFALSIFPVACVAAQSSDFAVERDDTGTVKSILVGGLEILRQPIELSPGTIWKRLNPQPAEAAATNTISMECDKGKAELGYIVDGHKLVIMWTHHLGNYQTWKLRFSDNVLAVENLQSTLASGAESLQYVNHGEVRPLPVTSFTRLQRMRLYLKNGAKVIFWHDGWGAPFNLDEMGSMRDDTYQRNLVDTNQPMRICFKMESLPNIEALPAPVFSTRWVTFGNIFYHTYTGNKTLAYSEEQPRFKLQFSPATMSRFKASKKWSIVWSATDFYDRLAGSSSIPINMAELQKTGFIIVPTSVKGFGWFSVTFSLVADKSAKVTPSSYRARFAVFSSGKRSDYSSSFPERPDATVNGNDYTYCGLMGLRCVRESHTMRDYFPGKGKINWKDLDSMMDRAASESKKWNTEWFFQANERPAWCTDEDYEQIAFDLVSHCKDRCKTWEVENEPNFRMSPEDYTKKCLIPFARGAKRADPTCRVIGPACVSVRDSITFLKAIIAGNALQYLDGISTHTYVGPGEPWELYGNPEYLSKLHELALEKPLWQTEQGYDWSRVPRQEQARYVVRQYLQGFAAGISNEHHFYFYPVHNGFEPWYLVEGGREEGIAGTLEPGGVALRIMNEQLAGTKFMAMKEPTTGVYAARFNGKTRDIYAVWTLDFKVDIELHGQIISAVDIMGNPIKMISKGKNSIYQANGYPVYISVAHNKTLDIIAPSLVKNLALISAGTKVTASSSVKGNGPENVIDGLWAIRDLVDGLQARTQWESAKEGCSQGSPEWLEITLPKAQTITRAMLINPNSAIDATPRDLTLEASIDGKQWKTVATDMDRTAWISLYSFPAISAKHVRLKISKLNDGWHLQGRWMYMVRDEFKRYTNMHARVYDLMLFAP